MQTSLMPKTRVVHCSREEYDVYIARPSLFGNPFTGGTKTENIADYERWIRARPALVELARRNLRGKRLGCYCAPEACHGDVLAKICDELINVDSDHN